MSYRLRIPLALLLFCYNSWAVADARWFQVELIVFEQQAVNTELFEQTESAIKSENNYADVKPGTQTLGNAFNRLKRSSTYQPLYYQSWKISVPSRQLSLPIEVSAPELGLKGWLKIQRGNLLHVLVDLEYTQEAAESAGLIYRLNEKRRVLLNEVHYLDHPYFGLVVKVSPVESE